MLCKELSNPLQVTLNAFVRYCHSCRCRRLWKTDPATWHSLLKGLDYPTVIGVFKEQGNRVEESFSSGSYLQTFPAIMIIDMVARYQDEDVLTGPCALLVLVIMLT